MTPRSVGTRHLFGKFLLLLLPVFATATAAGLLLISQFYMRDEQNQLNARVGNLAARVGSIIVSQSAAADSKSASAYLGLLLADQAIMCAELADVDGHIVAEAPRRLGCKGQDAHQLVVMRMPGQNSGQLRLRYSNNELAVIRHDKRMFTELALVVGLLVTALASAVCFRLFVGRPVGAMLAAIRKSAELGTPAMIDNPPNDELGTVMIAFNDMQARLKQEADSNLAALRRLDHLYNETPALLFSIDRDGQITSVSGHWLEQTGYARQDVISKHLTTFVYGYDGSDGLDLAAVAGNGISNLPMVLTCKNGSSIDILLSAIPSKVAEGDGSGFLCVMSDVSSLNAARRKLQAHAVTDHLTGLPNRQALFEFLARIANEPVDEFHKTAVLFVDLDNFKWVNDTHGHDAGDALLRSAAGRLKSCLGGSDFLARLGGDEFAIVLRNLRDTLDAHGVARRIADKMSDPFDLGSATAFVGCSVGIAESAAGGGTTEDLLRLADIAMYKSKQDGRNRITIYTHDLGLKIHRRDSMAVKIRSALKQNEFRLYFQPLVALETMRPMGAEALLRILSPSDGLISPAEVIKVAEETGLMGQIGEWVVGEGIATVQRWLASGLKHHLSINLSPRQLDPAVMSALLHQLRENPETARHLVFELTETALMQNSDVMVRFFDDVRETGAGIALDDFGTGYSSLNHISKFPVDIVKIDRSFIRHIDNTTSQPSRRNHALVQATATLCQELGIAVVAEGIETTGELEAVRAMGITYGQGYLFTPPKPEDAFHDWIAAFREPATASVKAARRRTGVVQVSHDPSSNLAVVRRAT